MNYKIQMNISQSSPTELKALYDFDSFEILKYHQEITSKGKFTLENDRIRFTPLNNINLPIHSYFMKLDSTFQNQFILMMNKVEFNDSDNHCYLVENSTYSVGNAGYRLKIGDVIKLGKVIFRIRDLNIYKTITESKVNLVSNECNVMRLKNQNYNKFINTTNEQIISDQNSFKGKFNRSQKTLCRICLGVEEVEFHNPLINPCKCSGTMKFIHLLCLKKWVNSKLEYISSERLIIYKIQPLICELCHEQIPDQIKIGEKIISTIDIECPENINYLTFESLKKKKNDKKYIYIIKMQKEKSFDFGRANTCKVVLSDASISKEHCKITIIKGNFYLKDLKSKFGTLPRIQTDIVLLPYKKLTLQFKNSLLCFSVKRSVLSYFKCKCNFRQNFKDYNDVIDQKFITKFESVFYLYEYKGLTIDEDEVKDSENEYQNKIIEITCNTANNLKTIDQKDEVTTDIQRSANTNAEQNTEKIILNKNIIRTSNHHNGIGANHLYNRNLMEHIKLTLQR